MIYLTDPEGNGIEMYWDRPREEWPLTEDGDLAFHGMTQIPLPEDALEELAPGDAHVPEGTDLGHIHLHVSSIDAAEAFYGEALGFGLTVRMPDAAFFAASDYHHHIGANTWNGRGSFSRDRLGLSWFEIVVPNETSITAVRDRVAQNGYPTTDAADGDGFHVEDPDGLRVRFRHGNSVIV